MSRRITQKKHMPDRVWIRTLYLLKDYQILKNELKELTEQLINQNEKHSSATPVSSPHFTELKRQVEAIEYAFSTVENECDRKALYQHLIFNTPYRYIDVPSTSSQKRIKAKVIQTVALQLGEI